MFIATVYDDDIILANKFFTCIQYYVKRISESLNMDVGNYTSIWLLKSFTQNQ